MGLSTKAELIERASLYILDFLVQSYGEDKYNSIKTKIIIKSILKNDEKKVRKTFILPSETALIDEVLYFLYHVVFVNTEYFSTEKLSVEQENNLWEKFLSNCTEKMDIWKESKSHLIACVNYHNNEICRRLIDDMSLLNLKISERDNKKIQTQLNQVISTLENNTELQCEDVELDYLNLQLESILKAMRLELERLRKIQNRCLIYIVIIFASLLIVPILGKYSVINGSFGYTFIIAIGIVLIVMSCVLMIYIYLSIRKEKIIDRFEIALFEFHYELYKEYISKNRRFVNGKVIDYPNNQV